MADEDPDISQDPQYIGDHELFSESGPGEPDPRQVFGDLIGPDKPQGYGHDKRLGNGLAAPESRLDLWQRLQWVLICGIGLVCGLLAYLVIKAMPPAGSHATSDTPNQVVIEGRPEEPHTVARDSMTAGVGGSRADAEEYLCKGQFDQAAKVLRSLIDRYAVSAGNEASRDYLLWRLALCEQAMGRSDQASGLLKMVSESRYPVLRALAHYHLGLEADRIKRYLDEVGSFYQALALADAMDPLGPWAQEFRRNCQYMIARTLILEALSLREDPIGLPDAFTVIPSLQDPWARLDDDLWSAVIRFGASQFNDALMGPIVEQAGTQGCWKVVCNGASLEDVLKRLSARTGIDISWTWEGMAGTAVVDMAARRRPVYAFAECADPQQALEVVVGSVGLSLVKDPKGTTVVVDPYNYRSLGEHLAILRQKTIALWRQFILDWDHSDLLAGSYLALGLLYEHDGQQTEAIAQYGLAASRSSDVGLVSYALWRSGLLREQLADYVGAREELLRLTEQYPQAPMASAALMRLADLDIRVHAYEQAAAICVKAYHLSASPQAQMDAASKAGYCLYLAGQYQQAIRWLDRYIEIAGAAADPDALIWLGRSYLALGQPGRAVGFLEKAIEKITQIDKYLDTVRALVDAYLAQGDHIKALAVLDGPHPVQIRQRERVQVDVLKAKVLSSIGLNDRVASILEESYKTATDPNQKLTICILLGRCYQGMDRLERARDILTEGLMLAQTSEATGEIAMDLAYVLFRLGRMDKAISLCQQVLKGQSSGQVKNRAKDLLYAIYIKRGDYDRASKVLLLSEQG
ncbi:MAG: tetratricopeptide repeat protein [Sedimentisphaerales bacterium]|jgi:tetratricopeptide (TPR) repeat protein|nr:tetratricopeptide repeat protein [Sedimentisphaerales bacterium]